MSPVPLTRIVVLAKAPVAGRSKTRLVPPYTLEQAATLARACLLDTLDTILMLAASEPGWNCQLSLEGAPGPWLPANVRIVPQCEGTHDVRIGRAIEDAVEPIGGQVADAVLLVGMDTPQLAAEHLQVARNNLLSADATLGLAEDGGWWLLGLRAEHARRASTFLADVPTSTAQTGHLQRGRLIEHGLSVGRVPVLRDIDTAADLESVLAGMRHQRRTSRLTAVAAALPVGALA